MHMKNLGPNTTTKAVQKGIISTPTSRKPLNRFWWHFGTTELHPCKIYG